MKRSGRRRRLLSWEAEESINLTPLLDVIFNLIFFFLLATTLRQSKAFLDLRLPSAQRASLETPPKKTLVISLTRENKIYMGKKEFNLESLENELKNTAPSELDKLIVQGDALAHHETVVKVLDVCVRSGHTDVSIEVKKEASTPP